MGAVAVKMDCNDCRDWSERASVQIKENSRVSSICSQHTDQSEYADLARETGAVMTQ
jgi:hypothetical protein